MGIVAEQQLKEVGKTVEAEFVANKRVLSMAEYLQLVAENPRTQLRNAAQYVLDMFDHYGSSEVRHPTGTVRRFTLFDAPWSDGAGRLIGQEDAQNAIYRIVSNFVRQRRIDRFILLHGPNGSSKSTITDLISQGMEHYSTSDKGACYRFNWVFPTKQVESSGIGFGDGANKVSAGGTYAHFDDSAIDARMPCELKDHPLLLIPRPHRQMLVEKWLRSATQDGRVDHDFRVADYIMEGDLSHRSKMIYESLLSVYEGDYLRVLKHVQVERFYVSRRYQIATARVEPQMAVDASVRQVTMDSSLSSLPSALQNLTLHKLDGELVYANRGVIDFADMFKRPLEASKYLLTAVEDGHVALNEANLYFDLVFVGSVNETHLNALMGSPEWMSFKARMELVRVPYLLDYRRESQIYEVQLSDQQIGKPIAPHVSEAIALWTVLTRMHRPDASNYEDPVRSLVTEVTPADKAHLYAEGRVPKGFNDEQRRRLQSAIPGIYRETAAAVLYEGRTGASPREARTVLMNAAQDIAFDCLGCEALLTGLDQLVSETSVYDYLRQEVKSGYYDHRGFIDQVRSWYLDVADREVRQAVGLVEEASYSDLFQRYVTHATHQVRGEKLRNEITGATDDPDERLMSDVEGALGVEKSSSKEFRQNMMTRIGAWSVDNPGERPDYTEIFSEHFSQLKEHHHHQQKERVGKLLRNALSYLDDPKTTALDDAERGSIADMLGRLDADHGYKEPCAREVLTQLVRHRYSD